MALLLAPQSEPPADETIFQIINYRRHVLVLASQLERAVSSALATVRDEAQLSEMASGLLKAELDRQSTFAPLFASAAPHDQAGTEWRKLGEHLRQGVNAELAAMRDGRLRLEFRRAEMINQRDAATRVRVVLSGGAQIRLYLNMRPPDDPSAR